MVPVLTLHITPCFGALVNIREVLQRPRLCPCHTGHLCGLRIPILTVSFHVIVLHVCSYLVHLTPWRYIYRTSKPSTFRFVCMYCEQQPPHAIRPKQGSSFDKLMGQITYCLKCPSEECEYCKFDFKMGATSERMHDIACIRDIH